MIVAGVQDLKARLQANVPELLGFHETADLAAMVAAKNLPPKLPAAILLWAGDRPRPNDMDNIVRQDVASTFSIIIVTRQAGDASGAAGAASGGAIADKVILAVVGWQPEDGETPFEYAGGQLAGIQAGAVFIKLDFVTRWTLRQ